MRAKKLHDGPEALNNATTDELGNKSTQETGEGPKADGIDADVSNLVEKCKRGVNKKKKKDKVCKGSPNKVVTSLENNVVHAEKTEDGTTKPKRKSKKSEIDIGKKASPKKPSKRKSKTDLNDSEETTTSNAEQNDTVRTKTETTPKKKKKALAQVNDETMHNPVGSSDNPDSIKPVSPTGNQGDVIDTTLMTIDYVVNSFEPTVIPVDEVVPCANGHSEVNSARKSNKTSQKKRNAKTTENGKISVEDEQSSKSADRKEGKNKLKKTPTKRRSTSLTPPKDKVIKMSEEVSDSPSPSKIKKQSPKSEKAPIKSSKDVVAEGLGCRHCGYIARTSAAHVRHMKKCDQNIADVVKVHPHKCKVCNYGASKRSLVVNHMETHGIFECVKCKFVADDKESLHSHVNTEHKDKANLKFCRLCKRHIKCDEITLEKHIEDCAGRVPVICPECKREFKFQSLLKVHMNTHFPDQPKKYSCPQCDYKSNYKGNLQKHISCVHEKRARTVKCLQCDRMFYSEDCMRKHQKVHSVDRPFGCGTCGKTFKTSTTCREHEDCHLTKRSFNCKLGDCTKNFTTSKRLKYHMKEIHKSERTYHCPEEGCEVSFFRLGHLQRHETTHTGERIYACEWPKCTKKFRHEDNLKVHHLKHTNAKPVKCPRCDFTCRQKNSLRFHMKKFHKESVTTSSACAKEPELPKPAPEVKGVDSGSPKHKDLYDFNSDESDHETSNPIIRQRYPKSSQDVDTSKGSSLPLQTKEPENSKQDSKKSESKPKKSRKKREVDGMDIANSGKKKRIRSNKKKNLLNAEKESNVTKKVKTSGHVSEDEKEPLNLIKDEEPTIEHATAPSEEVREASSDSACAADEDERTVENKTVSTNDAVVAESDSTEEYSDTEAVPDKFPKSMPEQLGTSCNEDYNSTDPDIKTEPLEKGEFIHHDEMELASAVVQDNQGNAEAVSEEEVKQEILESEMPFSDEQCQDVCENLSDLIQDSSEQLEKSDHSLDDVTVGDEAVPPVDAIMENQESDGMGSLPSSPGQLPLDSPLPDSLDGVENPLDPQEHDSMQANASSTVDMTRGASIVNSQYPNPSDYFGQYLQEFDPAAESAHKALSNAYDKSLSNVSNHMQGCIPPLHRSGTTELARPCSQDLIQQYPGDGSQKQYQSLPSPASSLPRPPDISGQRLEILTCDRQQSMPYSAPRESSVQRLTNSVYESMNALTPPSSLTRDSPYIRPPEGYFTASSASSFSRYPEASFTKPVTPYLPQDNLHRPSDGSSASRITPNPSLLHRPAVGDELLHRGGVTQPVPHTHLPATWPGQEARPTHWNQNSYLHQSLGRPANTTANSYLGKDNYLTNRDFVFDSSCRSLTEHNMFPGMPVPPQQRDLSHDALHSQFDLSSYFSGHPYQTGATAGLDYSRSTSSSAQKTFDSHYRPAVTDFRGIPQPPSTDMFGGINVNNSFNLDKYVYPRESVYHPQHIAENTTSAFLAHTGSSQHAYDYARRSLYPQNSPYSFVDNRQYASAVAGAKLSHHPGTAGVIAPERDLMARTNAADTQLQDPYRCRVLYNVMNRYFE